MTGFQDLNIQPLITQFNLETFVETGCHTGEGLIHAYNSGLTTLYSCDIIGHYVDIAKSRLGQAAIFHLDSKQFLEQIIGLTQGPCLFWLDAHFPDLYGQEFKEKDLRFPLLEELKIISKKVDIAKDVIMVDDIRVFSDTENLLYQPDMEDKYKIDYIKVKELTSLFPLHKYEFINFAEGLLIFTPK